MYLFIYNWVDFIARSLMNLIECNYNLYTRRKLIFIDYMLYPKNDPIFGHVIVKTCVDR